MTSKTLRRLILFALFVLTGQACFGLTPGLHSAARDNDVELARTLINAGANVNATTSDRTSALFVAAVKDSYEVAELLLENGADPNLGKAKDGYAPLHYVQSGKMADLLLRHGADPNAVDKEGTFTVLGNAIGNHRNDVLLSLLNHGADVGIRDRFEMTPLHEAASKGNAEAAALLLKYGAEVDAQDDFNGDTPLGSVWSSGSAETAKVLIEHGADVNAKSKANGTPLHSAAFENTVDIAALLIKNGAHVNARNDEGLNPLHNAAMENAYETAKLLLKHGADVHVKSKKGHTSRHNGATPLHLAVGKNSYETAELLLQHSANARAEKDDGTTPLGLARSDKMRALLQKHGAL